MKKPTISDLTGGISSQFFVKHMATIIFMVIVAFIYISARFDCITARGSIVSLEHKLDVLRTDVQRERALYMSSTCEEQMQNRVNSVGLDLTIQERPPYKLIIHK